jgi:4-hydroxyacetophenone monooxygenase
VNLDELRERLKPAQPTALLMTTAYLTGDVDMLRDEWRGESALLANAGPPEDQLSEILDLCAHKLLPFVEAVDLSPGGREDVRRAIVRWATGMPEDDLDDVMPLSDYFLALDGDPGASEWTLDEIAPDRDFHAIVIGAGMSGLVAAYRLKQAGIPYTIFEKADDLGGTWRDNVYPGCRVDAANHLYSFSFVRYDWPSYFCEQPRLFEYLRSFAEREGLVESIRFGAEVVEARWDDERLAWNVEVRSGDAIELHDANVVISSVGQLNRPNIPPSLHHERFEGPLFHSAQWDRSVDITNRRIAIIGTGASAFQIIPEVAKSAAEVVVFQRNAPWLLPTPHYRQDVPADVDWLFKNLPAYYAWYRLWLFLPSLHGLLAAATVDEDYPPTERAISAANEEVRVLLTRYIESQIADAPQLRDIAIPTYPVGAKRLLRDDGTYIAALARDNVTVVTDPITTITESGVETVTGHHEVDVICCATGFRASEFLVPMSIVGREGRELHDSWDGDARAYLGMTVPGFPNFFLVYGPNTNLAVHGNLVFFFEREVSYILEAIRLILEKDVCAIDVREDVYEQYTREVNDANEKTAWGWSGVSTWYRNARGRSTQNWPYTVTEFWKRTSSVDEDDYEVVVDQQTRSAP